MNAVLEGDAEGLRVAEIGRTTGLDHATVHRLLATLQAMGYVAPVSRFRYGPGERWATHVPWRMHGQDMARCLQPVLGDISAACGDAAFAVVREGALSHCVARQVGSYPVQVLVIQVGTKQPLGVGAAGLALLSALTDREVDSAIALNAAALPLYGNMSPARMKMLVEATRARGWSVVGNHATQGVLAVGRCVHDEAGRAVAGISVASTEARMPVARQRQVAQVIRKALRARGLKSGE